MPDSETEEPVMAAIHEGSGSVILFTDPVDREFFASSPGYMLRLATPEDEQAAANSVRY